MYRLYRQRMLADLALYAARLLFVLLWAGSYLMQRGNQFLAKN